PGSWHLLGPARSKAVDRTVADPNAQNLCVREAGQQVLARTECVIGNFEGPGIDIHRDNPAIIRCFNLRSHQVLVDSTTPPGELPLGVASLANRHRIPPFSGIITAGQALIRSATTRHRVRSHHPPPWRAAASPPAPASPNTPASPRRRRPS